MFMPKAGVRTWEEIEQVQKHFRETQPAPAAPAQDQDAVFAPSALPERMFHETRRHMQRIEFYQGRQTAALETLAQAQMTAEPAMSLRDAAALAALQAFTQRQYVPLTDLGYVDDTKLPSVAKTVARHAFMFADAFIAAREGKSE
jgi:hypothetical protein